MRLLYGTSSPVQLGDANATQISPQRELLRNAAGVGYRFRVTYGVTCSFTVSGNADCTSKMNAIDTVLALQNQNLKFQYDDNSDTPNSATSASTFSGVRCISHAWLPTPGGQFATWRSFSANFEWEQALPSGAPLLLDFEERVMIDNPPAQYAGLEAVNGVPPAFFPTVDYPICRATQTGFAVGLSSTPNPAAIAPPLWTPDGSTIIMRSKPTSQISPKRIGSGSSYDQYRIEWTYMFESTSALAASPNVWTG